MTNGIAITLAVEGPVDEAVARRLIVAAGGLPGRCYGRTGKAHLCSRVRGYNQAAAHAPWFVLMDLDDDPCAPELRTQLLPTPADGMCLRIAVREVEAWLLADRQGIAQFLSVPATRIPVVPDTLQNAKEAVITAARHSRARAVREDIVPREGSGRAVGPGYSSRVAQYAAGVWRPEVAASASESLGRGLVRLRELIQRH